MKILTEKDLKGINGGVAKEMLHHLSYLLLANCMQKAGYFGFQKLFLRESAEELEHYQKHVNFVNDIGDMAIMPSSFDLPSVVKTPVEAVKTAMDLEFALLDYYDNLYSSSDTSIVKTHLKFYIDTQVEAVGYYKDLMTRIKASEDDKCALLIIDNEVK